MFWQITTDRTLPLSAHVMLELLVFSDVRTYVGVTMCQPACTNTVTSLKSSGRNETGYYVKAFNAGLVVESYS